MSRTPRFDKEAAMIAGRITLGLSDYPWVDRIIVADDGKKIPVSRPYEWSGYHDRDG